MANNLNRKWMVTAIPQNKSARKRFEDLTPIQNISSGNGSFSAPSIPELLAIDNINDYFLKNNLPKWVNPQTATLGQTINNNIQNNIPSFDFNIAVTTRGNNQQTPKYDKIFTPEDIEGFSSDGFAKHEKEIRGQWGSIGIPTNNELQNSGAIYIAPYIRSDGVQVKGHYRSR